MIASFDRHPLQGSQYWRFVTESVKGWRLPLLAELCSVWSSELRGRRFDKLLGSLARRTSQAAW